MNIIFQHAEQRMARDVAYAVRKETGLDARVRRERETYSVEHTDGIIFARRSYETRERVFWVVAVPGDAYPPTVAKAERLAARAHAEHPVTRAGEAAVDAARANGRMRIAAFAWALVLAPALWFGFEWAMTAMAGDCGTSYGTCFTWGGGWFQWGVLAAMHVLFWAAVRITGIEYAGSTARADAWSKLDADEFAVDQAARAAALEELEA